MPLFRRKNKPIADQRKKNTDDKKKTGKSNGSVGLALGTYNDSYEKLMATLKEFDAEIGIKQVKK